MASTSSESTPLLESEGGAAPPPSSNKNTLLRQLLLGLVIALPSVPPGMSFGFPAVALGQLNFNISDASWFASIAALAIPVGCLLCGPVMDNYGRRPAMLLINVVSLVGWLLLAVHTSPATLGRLYTGRFLTGLATGLASVPAAVYAAECLTLQNPELRSALITWSTVALSSGILFVYVSGALLAYYKVAYIAAVISVCSFVLIAIFIPESPSWLLSKGRSGDAEWAQKELGLATPKPIESQPTQSFNSVMEELKKPEAYKPLLIMIFFFFFQQFSGVHVVITYMVDVVRAAGVVTLNPYFVAVVGGAVIVVVAISASIIYPTTGVRAIAVISGLGITGSMFFIGTFLLLRRYWVTRVEWYFLNWFPLFAVGTNIATSSIGFLILPWSMLGEVFPAHVKGVAGGIATCFGYLFSFIAIKTFPYLLLSLGSGGVFFFYGLMALLGTCFVFVFLPETTGKTLQEIVDSFSKSKPSTSQPQQETEISA